MNWIQRTAATLLGLKGMSELHSNLGSREHLLSATGTDAQVVNYGYAAFVAHYRTNVWAKKAVDVISRAFRGLPVLIMENDASVKSHPLLTVLQSPNKSYSAVEMWERWCTDMMLGGESGLEFVKGETTRAPAEFWHRQPTEISVLIESARYQRVGGYRVTIAGDPFDLGADDLIFARFYNPSNVWRGLPPFLAAALSLQTDKKVQQWSYYLFADMARPDAIVKAPAGTTPDERRQIQAQFEAQAMGRNRIAVLEDGVTDVQVLSFPPKDTAWRDVRELSREEIGAAAGVPDEMMGWGRDTYENFATAENVFWRLTVKPLGDFRDDVFTRFMREHGVITPAQRIQTDYSEVPAMAEDVTAKIDRGAKLYQMGVPFNTIDTVLGLGVGPVVDGDKPRSQGAPALGLAPDDLPGDPDKALIGELRAARLELARAAAGDYDARAVAHTSTSADMVRDAVRDLLPPLHIHAPPAQVELKSTIVIEPAAVKAPDVQVNVQTPRITRTLQKVVRDGAGEIDGSAVVYQYEEDHRGVTNGKSGNR